MRMNIEKVLKIAVFACAAYGALVFGGVLFWIIKAQNKNTEPELRTGMNKQPILFILQDGLRYGTDIITDEEFAEIIKKSKRGHDDFEDGDFASDFMFGCKYLAEPSADDARVRVVLQMIKEQGVYAQNLAEHHKIDFFHNLFKR